MNNSLGNNNGSKDSKKGGNKFILTILLVLVIFIILASLIVSLVYNTKIHSLSDALRAKVTPTFEAVKTPTQNLENNEDE